MTGEVLDPLQLIVPVAGATTVTGKVLVAMLSPVACATAVPVRCTVPGVGAVSWVVVAVEPAALPLSVDQVTPVFTAPVTAALKVAARPPLVAGDPAVT